LLGVTLAVDFIFDLSVILFVSQAALPSFATHDFLAMRVESRIEDNIQCNCYAMNLCHQPLDVFIVRNES